jgi:fructose-1-phosphate kinase PfkB-like protein
MDEIRNSLKVPMNSEMEISQVLTDFYKQGTNLAFITNGKVDIFASKADFHYKISVPKVIEKDATGSGDAFVAGIIYGLEKSLIFNDFVKLAASLGAQNAASWEVCKVDPSSAKKLEDDVSIVEIGKKIKLIDDSPTI